MERRCMPSFLNAHGFDPRAFGSRRTAWSYLGFPSPPGARGSQGEAVHSLAPDLPAARTLGPTGANATPICSGSTCRPQIRRNSFAWQSTGQSNSPCFLLEILVDRKSVVQG